MPAEQRRSSDPWGDVPSADIRETQATKRASALCHVENVHGNVINVQMTSGMNLSDLLKSLSVAKTNRSCGA